MYFNPKKQRYTVIADYGCDDGFRYVVYLDEMASAASFDRFVVPVKYRPEESSCESVSKFATVVAACEFADPDYVGCINGEVWYSELADRFAVLGYDVTCEQIDLFLVSSKLYFAPCGHDEDEDRYLMEFAEDEGFARCDDCCGRCGEFHICEDSASGLGFCELEKCFKRSDADVSACAYYSRVPDKADNQGGPAKVRP